MIEYQEQIAKRTFRNMVLVWALVFVFLGATVWVGFADAGFPKRKSMGRSKPGISAKGQKRTTHRKYTKPARSKQVKSVREPGKNFRRQGKHRRLKHKYSSKW